MAHFYAVIFTHFLPTFETLTREGGFLYRTEEKE